MAIVGRATVVVQALADTFRKDLQKQFAAAEKDADAAGASMGGRFGHTFSREAERGVSNVNMDGLSGSAEQAGDAGGKRFSERFRTRLRELEQERFGGLESAGGSAGESSGRSFSLGFRRSSNIGIDATGLTSSSGRAGDESGTNFGERFKGRLGGLGDSLSGIFSGVRNSASNAGDDSGRGFFDNLLRRSERGAHEFESTVEGAGSNIGRNLSAIKFDLPDIGGGLATKIIALVPLVGILGGALAALVGGLTAMAAAASFAAGSLSILATGLSVLVGGAVTGFLAFGGIGKALTALGAAQAAQGKNAVKAGRQQEAAARAIESAQERVVQSKQRVADAEWSLAQARKSAADDAERDTRAVADAERHLIDAQKDARQAQEDLTQARIDAKSRLEDLQLQLRGSVLSEEEATVRLHRARESFQKTIADPSANADARKQAEIDLQQAELALDEASKRRRDVTTETAAANKAGVEGAPAVVKAKDDINKSNQRVKDAEQAVADARKKQTDDALNDAHAIMKAQRELADAQHGVAQALKDLARAQRDAADGAAALSSAADKAKYALAQLSPEAQKFVTYLFGLKPILKDLQAAAGQNLFGPLQASIHSIVTGFLPTFRQALVVTGGGLGQMSTAVAKAFNVKEFKDNFAAVAEGNVPAFAKLGTIAGNVLRGITGLARAAQPVFMKFLGWIEKITGAFAKKFEGKKNIDDMTTLIGRMGKEAEKIGHIFGATFGIIGNIFKAALPSGQALNSSLLTTLKHFQAWTGTKAGQDRMRTFFQSIIPPVKAVGRFIVSLSKAFLKLGEDGGKGAKGQGGIVKTFDLLSKNMPKLGHAIETFTTKTAPAIIKIIAQILDVFDKLAKSPALTIFFKVLGIGVGVIKIFIDLLQIGPIGKFTGALLGMVAAFFALKKAAQVTGLKALFQAGQQGVAKPGTDRAKRSSGLGSFFQGVRGNRVVAKDDVEGKTAPGEVDQGKRRASNVFGSQFSSTRGTHAAPREPRTPLRQRFRAPRGEAGAVRPGVAAGAATVALVGLAVAPALLKGDIKGLKEATANIGQTIKDNLSTLLLVAGPVVFGKLGQGIKAARAPIAAGAKSLGGLIGTGLKSAGGAIAGLSKSIILVGGQYLKMGAIATAQAIKTGAQWVLTNAVMIATSVAQRAVTVAQWLMNAAMDANPIGLIVIAIAALAAGLIYAYKHSEAFRNIVKGALEGVQKAFSVLWGIVKPILEFFKHHLELLLIPFGPLGIAIIGIIEAFKHFAAIKKVVGDAISGITGFLHDLPEKMLGFVKGIGSAASKIGSSIFDGIKNGISGALGAVVDLQKAILRGLQDLFNKFIVEKINNAIPNDIGFSVAGHRISVNLPDNPIPEIHLPGLAKGATVLPRRGGTLAVLGEAGRAESVVDTGLINQRLREDRSRQDATVDELRRVRAILERISTLSGLTIQNLNAQSAPGEQAASSVPRALRALAFELGS